MNELTLISMITPIVLGAFSILAPFLTPRRYYFGLTVAPGFPESETGRSIRRGYVSAVAIATILAVAVMAALPQTAPAAAMFLVPLTAFVAFFHARSRVQSHSTPAVPVREAEISRRPGAFAAMGVAGAAAVRDSCLYSCLFCAPTGMKFRRGLLCIGAGMDSLTAGYRALRTGFTGRYGSVRQCWQC